MAAIMQLRNREAHYPFHRVTTWQICIPLNRDFEILPLENPAIRLPKFRDGLWMICLINLSGGPGA